VNLSTEWIHMVDSNTYMKKFDRLGDFWVIVALFHGKWHAFADSVVNYNMFRCGWYDTPQEMMNYFDKAYDPNFSARGTEKTPSESNV